MKSRCAFTKVERKTAIKESNSSVLSSFVLERRQLFDVPEI